MEDAHTGPAIRIIADNVDSTTVRNKLMPISQRKLKRRAAHQRSGKPVNTTKVHPIGTKVGRRAASKRARASRKQNRR